jgi:hypothetical protein
MPIGIRAGEGTPIIGREQIDVANESFNFDLVDIELEALGSPPIDMTWFFQKTSKWCWAASAQMILRSLGFASVEQCHVASVKRNVGSIVPNPFNCCSDLGPVVCNSACVEPDVRRIYQQGWDVQCTPVSGAVSFEDLNDQVNTLRKPVEIGIAWNGGGKHLLVVHGCYVNENDEGVVYVSDPIKAFGQGQVHYDELRTAYRGSGTWINTWTGITKA